MDLTQEMQKRIQMLEAQLTMKNQEVEHVKADYGARLQVIESKMAAVVQNENGFNSAVPKIYVNKPEVFTGEGKDSLDAFIGKMEIYLAFIPDGMKLKVAVSYLGNHTFDWFKVTNNIEAITTWERLKQLLTERFQPINRVKIARDKLAVWKQVKTVAQYNESFLKIITDIPNISADEVIDRYMRGLKTNISKELCTTSYDNLTTLMSHAISVEASQVSFTKSFIPSQKSSGPVPMDLTNTRLNFDQQKQKDYETGACFICHKKGCRSDICPQRNKVNNLEVDNLESQGKGNSQ